MKTFFSPVLLWGARRATPVLAADLPFKAAPPAVAPAAAFDWSGVYVGAHIGGGWATNDISDPGLGIVGALLGVPPVQTVDSSGLVGGLQAGWNYQIGRLVIGSEVDFSWADINGSNTAAFAPVGAGILFNRTLTANTDWTATSTIRLGYARDRWMFYSKAGAAFAHTNYTSNWTAAAGGATATLFTERATSASAGPSAPNGRSGTTGRPSSSMTSRTSDPRRSRSAFSSREWPIFRRASVP
jgi:outer membrane immunogenic protein